MHTFFTKKYDCKIPEKQTHETRHTLEIHNKAVEILRFNNYPTFHHYKISPPLAHLCNYIYVQLCSFKMINFNFYTLNQNFLL